MQIEELRRLFDSGKFHHATYRNMGTLWEGLWIYAKAKGTARGFEAVGCFNAYEKNPDLDAAIELLRHTGISVGSYGRG